VDEVVRVFALEAEEGPKVRVTALRGRMLPFRRQVAAVAAPDDEVADETVNGP